MPIFWHFIDQTMNRLTEKITDNRLFSAMKMIASWSPSWFFLETVTHLYNMSMCVCLCVCMPLLAEAECIYSLFLCMFIWFMCHLASLLHSLGEVGRQFISWLSPVPGSLPPTLCKCSQCLRSQICIGVTQLSSSTVQYTFFLVQIYLKF